MAQKPLHIGGASEIDVHGSNLKNAKVQDADIVDGESPVNKNFVDDKDVYNSPLAQSLVNSGISVGGAPAGTEVYNKTKDELLDLLFFPLEPPTYNAPNGSLSKSINGNREVGELINQVLTANFTQNDSGGLDVDPYEFFGGGLGTPPRQALNQITDTNYVIQEGSNLWSVRMYYTTGPVKNNSHGNPDPSGQILAGNIVKNSSLNGLWGYWIEINDGFVASPTNNTEVRARSGKVIANISNSFNVVIPAGGTKTLLIMLPGNRTINQVLLNNSVPIQSSFNKTLVVIDDLTSSGNTKQYTIFNHNNGVGYGSNTTYAITLNP